jgi:hypothetical protein
MIQSRRLPRCNGDLVRPLLVMAPYVCTRSHFLADAAFTRLQVYECWSHDEWGGVPEAGPDWGEVSRVAVTVDRHGGKASLAGHDALNLLGMLKAPSWLGWCRRNFPSWPLSAILRKAATSLLMDR